MNFAVVVFTSLMIVLSFVQIIVALGKPYGEYVWGGKYKVLPRSLRIGSIISIFVYWFMVSIIWDRAGTVDLYPNGLISSYGIYVLAAYFVVGVLMNAISQSKKERYTMTPIVLVLLICTFSLIR
jgi:hypothetical protein